MKISRVHCVLCLVGVLLSVQSVFADLPQLVTAKGNAIPTFSYQTGVPFTTRSGVVNVNGTFVNSFVYNPRTRTYQWRITAWTIGNDYTPQQQTAIQNNVVATYGVAIAAGANVAPSIGLDCHGYSLKSDSAGVYGNNVPTILADQGYKQVTANTTAVGDIVVYKSGGSITHTAVVSSLNANGTINKVTSRFGALGVYTGSLTQVPASYGPASQFWSAATAVQLIDPPSPDDLSDYADLPTENENPAGESEVNGFEGTQLNLDTQNGTNWSYELDAPAEGIFLTTGEKLTLFGQFITGASVSGAAAGMGDWNISTGTDPGTGDSTAVFTYEGANTDLLTNIDGFNITSLYDGQGDLNFEDDFNGTIGLAIGPVPEPSCVLLIGTIGMMGLSRRKRFI